VRHILVYSDSLAWGIVPNTRRRLPFDERWPGVLENRLHDLGRRVRVIEDCLNGRRTVWEDPFKPGRNGLRGLAQCIEIHSPLSLVILMLGTNDFQFSPKFNGADHRCSGLAEAYRAVSLALDCHFYDSSAVTSSSRVDGVHLDADQHLTLGHALADVVIPILGSG